MKRYVVLTKKRGETPLMALETWKAGNPAYSNIPASYAGRLDPMAEGKLLILLGDECKRQKAYTGLDKEYEIQVLVDVGSDTGDALGVVEGSRQETRVDEKFFHQVLEREIGAHERAYPAYSSKTVDGKPLFLHALEGTLNTISIPNHIEHIYRIEVVDTKRLPANAIQERVDEFLSRVPTSDEPSKMLGANFRINEVRASWERLFVSVQNREFTLVRLRIVCGSGTYMRSLAGRIGESLGTSALALSIKRTKIGKYWKGFWLKLY